MTRFPTLATTIAMAFAGLAACTRQAPDSPAPTAVVEPASAVARPAIPATPASDPSLPAASAAAGDPVGAPPAETSAPMTGASGSAAASGASQPP